MSKILDESGAKVCVVDFIEVNESQFETRRVTSTMVSKLPVKGQLVIQRVARRCPKKNWAMNVRVKSKFQTGGAL